MNVSYPDDGRMTGAPTGVALCDPTQWRYVGAAQQPEWDDPEIRDEICARLSNRPALVTIDELTALRAELAGVAAGRGLVLQAGDCAESFEECTPRHAERKATALTALADVLSQATGLPSSRIGRIAGQFAKPRSSPTEKRDGRVLPSFRGHIVNGEAPDARARRHRPARMLRAYEASHTMVDGLRAWRAARGDAVERVWTSHEALILDYEASLVRFEDGSGAGRVTDQKDGDGASLFLGSTHLPWVGERTRQSDGAHVRLLADVANPVACKVSGSRPVEEVLRVCERLDPERTPGRLTLIARFGANIVAEGLEPIARAVRQAGHPVIWLCDPMHGNTYTSHVGVKTRRLDDIVRDIRGFVAALRSADVRPGGLHLETSAEDVTECVGASVRDEQSLTTRYTTLCDPRLNPEQAVIAVQAFVDAL
jgi:3-deoxy-7-phosphoheptulonate synthase